MFLIMVISTMDNKSKLGKNKFNEKNNRKRNIKQLK